ncbi:NAD-dependent epimerase/dehydratase family protein [Denitrificimonas sp. JX-1]|uniref:NAD-dependent epimerase/dehydratase family protein n=1 Tax=Denitrificimonas halotolerans TaxID=3098930 RepID=A0ABU5GRQ1_9GAMM|nr:NAD-dependent epimerase/dehydratase family protein [Denitrificimonas sp. JX-1]MDY7219370.1 NAD-dependent epimerase/dehydratase family protein [Denitrificimonas sp. JX-1]
MQEQKRVVIVGCGDIGSRVAVLLQAQAWLVYGVRRNTAQLPEQVIPIAADLNNPTCPSAWPQSPIDYVVYAMAAQGMTEEGYQQAYVQGQKHLYQWLEQHQQQPKRVVFVSSSSVYGQADDSWIDETSVTEPSRWSGQIMLEAEQCALNSGHPTTVVRLTGIYGPGRNMLLRRVREGYHAPHLHSFTNRIHADDAAALIVKVLQADAQGHALESVYIGVDDAPVEQSEVVAWLQEQLQASSVPGLVLKPRSGSKRCSNARARALGWQPQYPSYKEGYAAQLAEFTG